MLEAYCTICWPLEADFLFESSHKMRVTPASSTYKLLYKAYAKANIEELIQKLVKHMEQKWYSSQ